VHELNPAQPAPTPAASKVSLPPRPMVLKIDRQTARDWLDYRNDRSITHNRKLSPVVVQRYADDMRRGNWDLTHQGIAFDTEGWLIDGQHRLAAVALSGVACEFWIFPDMPRDTFDKVDGGRARQAHQLLNGPNSVVRAAAVRFLAVADGTAEPFTKRAAYARLNNTQTLAEVRKWGAALEESVRSAVTNVRRSRVVAAPHAAVLTQALYTEHASCIPAWLEGLATGAMLAETDPRLRIRSVFSSRTSASVGDRTKAYAVIVKAWNAYVTGKTVRNLSFRDDETVPAVVGFKGA
jgi:hypothetical protein